MNQPVQAIPLLKSNQEQLAKISRRLEEVFRNLNLVHDLMVICAHAVTGEGDCGSEVSRCLELIGGNRLYGQLKVLTNIIERLGGETELASGNRRPLPLWPNPAPSIRINWVDIFHQGDWRGGLAS
jgi:hypothetical protein